ncbi:MAG: small subunit ribosomal protein [Solirubrobacteraceae bacterium]|jgi:small subunit ribosomal protein S6|nr:small subunit ribosomal protein [Solirubrobacteraceae bacterium]
MAATKPLYDLMLLLDAEAPSERRAEILTEVEAFIGRGGTIESKHDWGVRTLAYEIQHRKDAEYHLLQFTAPPDLIDRLRTMLKITDGVLRHRVIRLRPGTPPPPAMRAEPRPAAEVPAGEASAAEPAATEAPPAEPAPAEAQAPEAAPAAEPVAAPAEPAPEAEPAPAEPAEAPPAA